ncbi:hypothetical protein HDV64DRAFT_257443 [Trichoderma sp. TUCIM 5745]
MYCTFSLSNIGLFKSPTILVLMLSHVLLQYSADAKRRSSYVSSICGNQWENSWPMAFPLKHERLLYFSTRPSSADLLLEYVRGKAGNVHV